MMGSGEVGEEKRVWRKDYDYKQRHVYGRPRGGVGVSHSCRMSKQIDSTGDPENESIAGSGRQAPRATAKVVWWKMWF